jgi:hypothetical protein
MTGVRLEPIDLLGGGSGLLSTAPKTGQPQEPHSRSNDDKQLPWWIVGKQEVIQLSEDDDSNLGLAAVREPISGR